MDRRWTGIGDAVLAVALLTTAVVLAGAARWPEAVLALLLAVAWGAAAARRLAGRRAPALTTEAVAAAVGAAGPAEARVDPRAA